MESYLTPEELAQQLKVQVEDVTSLIEQGRLRAIRIGDKLRIRETEAEKLHVTCAAVSTPTDPLPVSLTTDNEALPNGSRWCHTRTGKKFRVSGSVAAGADIWPGRMRYPIKFPKGFMDAMLVRFSGREVPVGGTFHDPGRGSLGEFIQQRLKTKMNPAVWVAALLIDEGYANPTRRGYIRFRSESVKVRPVLEQRKC